MAKQTKITIETDTLLVFRGGIPVLARCPLCSAETERPLNTRGNPQKRGHMSLPSTILKSILTSASAAWLFVGLSAAQPRSDATGPDAAMPGKRDVGASTIATYPAGTILENVAIGRNGDLFVTAIDSGTIFQVSPEGSSRVFGQVQGPLLGLAFDTDGTLVAVGGTSVYRFEADGTPLLVMNIAGALDLNGVALFSPGTFLVADDSASTVWKVDVNSATAQPWLAGSLLTPPANGLPIGPNGVKLFRGSVYISVTGAGTLLRVPILRDGRAGTPEVFASSFQVDDFAFGLDGSVFAATQGGNIIRIHPNGSRTMMSTGTLGDAAVAFGHTIFDFKEIYVVNNGGAFLGLPGGPLPASIVRLATNVPGALSEW
jgi:sugar lactone lactonase YvrE